MLSRPGPCGRTGRRGWRGGRAGRGRSPDAIGRDRGRPMPDGPTRAAGGWHGAAGLGRRRSRSGRTGDRSVLSCWLRFGDRPYFAGNWQLMTGNFSTDSGTRRPPGRLPSPARAHRERRPTGGRADGVRTAGTVGQNRGVGPLPINRSISEVAASSWGNYHDTGRTDSGMPMSLDVEPAIGRGWNAIHQRPKGPLVNGYDGRLGDHIGPRDISTASIVCGAPSRPPPYWPGSRTCHGNRIPHGRSIAIVGARRPDRPSPAASIPD